MKSFIIIMLSLILPVFVPAQKRTLSPSSTPKDLDRLHQALNTAANDTIRMYSYYNLGLYYLEKKRDSAVYYADKTITLAHQLRLKLNEAGALAMRGYSLIALGNYPKSLESLSQSFKIAEDPASEKFTWNLPKGQTPHTARLAQLGFNNLHIGHLYGATGNIEKQKSSYLKSLNLAESAKDTFLIALADWALGDVYTQLDKLDSALLLEQEALGLQPHLDFYWRAYEGLILYNIGNIYSKEGKLTLALDAYQKSVNFLTEHNNDLYLQNSFLALGKLYKTLDRPDSSLFYARKSLETARVLDQPRQLAISYRVLSDVYSSRENRDSTLKYLQLYTALNDSLNSAEKKNLLSYQNIGFDEQIRLRNLEEERIQTQTRTRTYALLAGLGVFLVIGLILYRNNRQKQKANKVLETTLSNLKSTQSQLIQSEKMASLGELTAGIAHEIQNPLNFVNNFSDVNKEMIAEMKEEIDKGNYNEVKIIANDIEANEEKISYHGKRADTIVKAMLQHSRTSSGQKEPTDINALCDEYLRLAFHGLRAKDKTFNADVKTDFDNTIGKINVVPQDIGRVVLNLINNAFYAVHERSKVEGESYKALVEVSTRKVNGKLEITVIDNGGGIPDSIKEKIFQPFFTTKPTGEGTGLGLSLSYDIVTKGHQGSMELKSSGGHGAEFVLLLPA